VTSLYHDTLLEKVARDDKRYKPLLPSSPHTRYTRAWAERVGSYRWAARALEVIQFTQLFIEMGLRRKASPKTKWRGIVLLEFIKSVRGPRRTRKR
jgi:peroxin-16